MRERRNETISLLYSYIFLRSVLYTALIRLEPNLFCVSEGLQLIVAAVRPYLSFLGRLPRMGEYLRFP